MNRTAVSKPAIAVAIAARELKICTLLIAAITRFMSETLRTSCSVIRRNRLSLARYQYHAEIRAAQTMMASKNRVTAAF